MQEEVISSHDGKESSLVTFAIEKFICVLCPKLGSVLSQFKRHFDDDHVEFEYMKW